MSCFPLENSRHFGKPQDLFKSHCLVITVILELVIWLTSANESPKPRKQLLSMLGVWGSPSFGCKRWWPRRSQGFAGIQSAPRGVLCSRCSQLPSPLCCCSGPPWGKLVIYPILIWEMIDLISCNYWFLELLPDGALLFGWFRLFLYCSSPGWILIWGITVVRWCWSSRPLEILLFTPFVNCSGSQEIWSFMWPVELSAFVIKLNYSLVWLLLCIEQTALMQACQYGNWEVVQTLFLSRADVRLYNSFHVHTVC